MACTLFGATKNLLRCHKGMRNFLIWMRTARQLRYADYRGVFMLKCVFTAERDKESTTP